MAETLRHKQARFTRMTAQLILKASELGYELTYGETYRPPAWAAEMARQGKGIANSLHTLRLAADFNLFQAGVFLTSTEDHRALGEWWESIGGTWGGRFSDGNHYSLAHQGRK